MKSISIDENTIDRIMPKAEKLVSLLKEACDLIGMLSGQGQTGPPIPAEPSAAESGLITPIMMPISEAAECFGLSAYYVRKLTWNSKIKYIESGRKIYVNKQSLAEYIEKEMAKT